MAAMPGDNGIPMALAFSIVKRAAARKRIYAVRARKKGRRAEARLLAALGASEEAQARRLFNNLRGRIDLSENFLATIFNEELAEVLAEYESQLELARAAGNSALVSALTQLRKAETRLSSFYDRQRGRVAVADDQHYFVCPFCGYLATGKAPERCPVCGAAGESIREVAEDF
jgi:rubrerythrin